MKISIPTLEQDPESGPETCSGQREKASLANWLLIAFAASILYVALYQLPGFGDWDHVFYPVTMLDDPYEHPGFLNPPWTTVVIGPFRLLPVHAAGALWMLFSLAIVLFSARKLGADRLGLTLILGNPFAWFFVTLGQLDALVLLGLVLTKPPWDVLLAIKPQVLGTAILFRLRDYERRSWLLLGGALVLSLLIWWNWPSAMVGNWLRPGGVNHPYSHGIWPWGIPFGAALLVLAWKRKSIIPGAIASYFLAPYVGPGSIIVYATLIFSTAHLVVRLLFYACLWAAALAIYG